MVAKYYKINPATHQIEKEITVIEAQALRSNEYIREAPFHEKFQAWRNEQIRKQKLNLD